MPCDDDAPIITASITGGITPRLPRQSTIKLAPTPPVSSA
jgi:hypothetical protein